MKLKDLLPERMKCISVQELKPFRIVLKEDLFIPTDQKIFNHILMHTEDNREYVAHFDDDEGTIYPAYTIFEALGTNTKNHDFIIKVDDLYYTIPQWLMYQWGLEVDPVLGGKLEELKERKSRIENQRKALKHDEADYGEYMEQIKKKWQVTFRG